MSSPRTREIRSNVKQVDAVPSFGTGGLLMSVVALRGWLTPASHTRRMIPVDGTCGRARLFMVRPHIIRYRDAPKIGFEPLHAGGGMRYGGSIVK